MPHYLFDKGQLPLIRESPAIVDARIVNSIRSQKDGTQNIGQRYFKSGDPLRVLLSPLIALKLSM